jgi:hypothetical protein
MLRAVAVEERLSEGGDGKGEKATVIPLHGPLYATPVEDSWALSLKRFLEVVNELLQRAGSEERLFGIYGGNDGRAILLTEEMHEYLGSLPWIDRRWMPYPSSTIDTGE